MAFRQLHMLQLYFTSKVLPSAEQTVIWVILINIKTTQSLIVHPAGLEFVLVQNLKQKNCFNFYF